MVILINAARMLYRPFIGLLVSALSVGLLGGCHDDNIAELESRYAGDCDTVEVSFSADVQSIMQSNCVECHSSDGVSEGGVSLDRYEGVQTVAEDGRLAGVITHAEGYPPMPQPESRGQLPECDIETIKAWIRQGMDDN